MTRERLPDRRPNVTMELLHNWRTYSVTMGFDVTRDPNDHLGYGAGGPHFCLGAHLARMEIRIALEELYRRFPQLVVDGVPERAAMRQINGVKHLPVSARPS